MLQGVGAEYIYIANNKIGVFVVGQISIMLYVEQNDWRCMSEAMTCDYFTEFLTASILMYI